MSHTVDPALYPWFAPLPGPFIEHLMVRLIRTKRARPETAQRVLFELVREARFTTYFYMNPFVQARLTEKPTSEKFSTGWLLETLGAQAPRGNKEPVSQKTFSYWRSKGLVKNQQFGLPDYANAAALYIARIIDHDAERNFLPAGMELDEQDWWCFTQEMPEAPVQPWRASRLDELPSSTVCWTPWLGAVWEPGWFQRHDQTIAIRWAKLKERQPLSYALAPQDILRWYGSFDSTDLDDQDILQAAAMLVIQRLARLHKEHIVKSAFEALIHSDETV